MIHSSERGLNRRRWTGQRGFWDFEQRLEDLSREGDPLEKLAATVDFEVFRLLHYGNLRARG